MATGITRVGPCYRRKVVDFEVLLGSTSVATVNTAASQTKKKQLVLLPAFASLRTGTLRIKVLTAGKPVIVEGVGVSAV